MKNLTLTLTILTCIFVFFPTSAYGQNPEIQINGEAIYIPIYEQQPTIINGRTLVPLRAVMEELGFEIDWHEHRQRALLSRPRNVVAITVGHDYMWVAGQQVDLDVPAQIMNARTMVPVRAISEATGFDVDWDAENFVVNIIVDNLEWEVVPPLIPMVGNVHINFSPEELLQTLDEMGVEVINIDHMQDWGFIYAYLENPVRDGRRYDIGGHGHGGYPPFSFSFGVYEDTVFGFTRDGEMRFISVRCDNFTTATGIRIGDSRETIIATYGLGYTISPLVGDLTIQYFDGETYLIFSFRNDIVVSWQVSIFSPFDMERDFI